MIPLLHHFLLARYRTFASRSQLLAWQEKKLQRHLQWVCRHSPFYHAYAGKPLAEFPIMNKATMMAELDSINTRKLSKEQLMSVALTAEESRQFDQSKIADVTVGLSSGTSGQRGLFLADSRERQAWAGNILGKLLPTFTQRSRIALVLRANSPLYKTVARGPIQFHYADIQQPLEKWMAELDAFQPTLIIGSAQALQLCAQFSGQFGHSKIQPKKIISGAEVLTDQDRAFIENQLRSTVEEVYQCTEGFLASSDRQGQLRWNEDVVFIEKHWLNDEKTHYSPIITDFHRRTQPVIRYLLDDVIEAKSDSGIFEAIGSIAGRTGDQLLLPGRKSDVFVLPDLIYRAIALATEKRIDYCVRQTEKSTLEIESASDDYPLVRSALDKLFNQLGALPVTFRQLPPPQWTPTTKQRRVVNQCVS